jgi:signal transduction histidine kinase
MTTAAQDTGVSENDSHKGGTPMTAIQNPLRCSVDELRTLFLFEKLTDEQLNWLCERGHVEEFEPGVVYTEGDDATCFFVLLSGNTVLSRRVGADDVETTRTSQPGVYSGAMRAYLGGNAPEKYNGSMRVTQQSRFFVLDAADFNKMMNDWFPLAVHLLEGLFYGIRNSIEVVGQRERLLALGSLSAGLTHELNNPASAAVSATAALRNRVAGMRHKLAMIASGKMSMMALEPLIALQEAAVERVAKAPELSPMETSDREDLIGEWLDDHGIRDGWDLAPTFVQAGLDVDWLDQVDEAVPDDTLEGAIRWLNYTVESELLLNEIHDSTTRISTLVGAAKQYSQLDRAPFTTVNIHELLKSSLTMLSGKIGAIKVVKEFDRTLPPIPAYAAELNQVWTNLIDNAVAAMGGEGTLTVRTSRDDDDCLIVEIGDTGTGIPEEIQSRIFEPFFTTKPVGEGTGLGLDISYRIIVNKHHGDLSVRSKPGETWFRVSIPMTAPERTDDGVHPDDGDIAGLEARASG